MVLTPEHQSSTKRSTPLLEHHEGSTTQTPSDECLSYETFTKEDLRHQDSSRLSTTSEEDNESVTSLNTNAPASTYTAEDAIEHYGFGLFQLFLLLLCGTVWMVDAMEIILLSFLMPAIKREWELTGYQTSAIGSAAFLGMIGGAYTWGFISDRLGRKVAIACMMVFTLVFGIASAFSPNFWFLLAFRGLVGFGVAGSCVAFSLFSEFLPQRNRGIFLLVIEVFWTIGVVFEALLAWVCLYESENYHPFRAIGSWRVFLFATNIPMILVMAFVPFLPESHRFLLIRGKRDKLEKLYKRVAFWNHKPILEGEPTICKVNTGRVTDLLKPGIRWSMVTLIVLWICAAGVYYGVVILTPEYFSAKSGEEDGAGVFLETFITSAAELPGLIFSSILINTVGRKKTLFTTFAGTAAGLILLTLPANRAFLTVFAIVTRGMAMGCSSTVWVVSTEILPTTVRTTGMGIASSSSRISGALTPYISSVLFDINPLISIAVYVIVGVVGSLFSMMIPYETKGKAMPDTLEDRVSEVVRVGDEIVPV